MTINNPEAYCQSLWDWSCLDGCFGETKIKPTDVDGRVERNGYFLEIETKLPEVRVPQGQEITYKALLNTGVFTIMVVWGYPGKPERIRLMTRYTTRFYESVSIETFRELTKKWYLWADSQTYAPRFDED